MKLSIIITAHDEGLLAHKTMLAVFRALTNFKAKYEVIVHIDNGTPETEEYFARYKTKPNFVILKNHFGDLGLSRNFAVQKARGKYIAFLDADDLVSGNYFTAMVDALDRADQDIVVHPNYCISFEDFGSHYSFQILGKTTTPQMDACLLFAKNRWVSSLCAKKTIFLKYPYVKTENGIGHEDYILNIQLTDAGVLHDVAKETILFYRRKSTSLLRQNLAQNFTQPYTNLFSIEKWKAFEPLLCTRPEKNLAQSMRNVYVKMRNNRILNTAMTPMANLLKKITGKKIIPETKLPSNIMDEWKEVAKIELQIFPAPYILDAMTFYDTETLSDVSRAYANICKEVRKLPDYVFIVPWVVAGGSDKVLLNYLKAIKEIHPEWNIAVITMLKAKNEWRDRMPSNSYLLDFGNIADILSAEDRDLLLTRLLIQLKCQKLHIINSVEALHWLGRHQALVKKEFKISFSVFCNGIIPQTNCEGYWDFADPHALRVYHLIDKIYTDNTRTAKELVRSDGFDEEKITVHYQPTELTKNQNANSRGQSDTTLRVLWAGRISMQKNPQLLVRIANQLDPHKIRIDAYGRVDPDELEGFKFPKESPVLNYRGAFKNFADLDLSKYDVLLYTSRIDGMPNVILEAAAAGIVPIASNVGGISDFVQNGRTGFLINDANNENEYVSVINKIYDDRSILNPLIAGARKLLSEQYSWKKFVQDVKRDFGK